MHPADTSSPPPDPDTPLRGNIRCRGYQRISHGLFRLRVEGLGALVQLVRELESWLLVLPDGARFTHLTAARLLGWDVPKLPEGVPVFASVSGTTKRPRRPGLLCSRLVTTPTEQRYARGLPVDEPEEVLLRCARDLGSLDLQVLVESAIRAGDLDHGRMTTLLDSRRPGVRQLRTAYRLASGKTESAPETVLLAFHQTMQIAVEPQKELHADDGRLVARADLWVVGTDFFHEYDGEHHRETKQQATDMRRQRGLEGTPYVRKSFVLDDLLNHALVVMHELDRALERPHVLRRYQRWQHLVEQSLYHPVGRERLLNRWHRESGDVLWSTPPRSA